MVRFRRATYADAPALTALMHASAAYAGTYAAILEDYKVTETQIARDHVVVARHGNLIAGFYSLTSVTVTELDLFCLADEAQGSGLGRVMFEDLRNTAGTLGFGQVRIVSHPPSEGFYRRMGAVPAGMHPAAGRVTWDRPILLLSTAGA